MSRADVELLADMVRNPLNRPIPCNPGQWTAEGIFQHDDGREFMTGVLQV